MSLSEPNRREAEKNFEIQQIIESLQGLKFGTVHIIVQDGVVIQIERTEKKRLRKSPAENGSAR